jgi:outer membrane immunogenic protein
MRWLVVGIGVAFFLASAAPAVAHEPPFAWTGLYVGVNAGYSWGRAAANLDVSSVDGPIGSASRSIDVNGWLGGGHVGYNWQSQRWVYGLEADFQWTGEVGDISACVGPACATASYKFDWFGTVRGRLGYLVDPRSLVYVTGGLAYGHLTADFSGPTLSISDSEARAGWVVGGGIERAFGRNWMLRAEYLYMDLGTMRTELASTPPPGAAAFNQPTATVRTDFTDQIFRVGLSYKFGEAYAPLK